MARLIDLSNNNGTKATAAIRDPSVAAIYAKATEGLTFKDMLYHEFRRVAEGIKPFGGYLFLQPGSDGAAQARAFLAYAKPAPGDLQPVVDSETGSAAAAAKPTLAALHELEAHGFQPILYGSASYLRGLVAAAPGLRRFRVWQAEYGPVLHRVPGLSLVAWQFTDRLVVAKGTLRVDGSRILVRDLAAMRIPAHAVVKPVLPPNEAMRLLNPPVRKKPKPRRKPAPKPASGGEPPKAA